MRGHFLMRRKPCDILLGSFAEMMQQTLQSPPGKACEFAAAFHSSDIQHGGIPNGKKEFFTFVRVDWGQAVVECELSEPLESVERLSRRACQPGVAVFSPRGTDLAKTFVDSGVTDASVRS